MQLAARVAIRLAREKDLYIVIDADGLWLVQSDPEVVKGYKKAVLTPNVVEFERLCDAVVRYNSPRILFEPLMIPLTLTEPQRRLLRPLLPRLPPCRSSRRSDHPRERRFRPHHQRNIITTTCQRR